MTDIAYPALVRRAKAAFDNRQHITCADLCREILSRRKNDPEALILLARIEWKEGRRDKAIVQMQKYAKLYPKDVGGRSGLAFWLDELGRHREAITQYQKILRLVPHHPDAVRGLAHAYDRDGQQDKALQVLEPYLKAGKATGPMALVAATAHQNAKRYEQAIEVAAAYADRPDVDKHVRASLHFVLGQCHERLNQIDESFAAYKSANTLDPPPFDPDENDRIVDELMEIFSAENMAKLPRSTIDSEVPIFICCRPRSGSTLLDRIIGSHPEVHTVGERPILSRIAQDFSMLVGTTEAFPRGVLDMEREDADLMAQRYLDEVRAFNPKATRITNKSFANGECLGLIELLFPKARIIDLRRDPVDNCLACYMIDLQSQFPYSYDLEHLARAHVAYERLMDHWHKVLSIPMLRVSYEDIVADQEYWTRRIIDFLGLPWHEDCLRFHEVGTKKGSDTPTLSYNQVRQPIYKTSVGRAEKFAAHIGPLVKTLEDSRRLHVQASQR